NKGFEVERSVNENVWEKLSFVNSKAINGNSNIRLDYSYTDLAPLSGTNYYRLKQTDIDGSYKYSNVQLAEFIKESEAISIYPNPVSTIATVSGIEGQGVLLLINSHGQVQEQVKLNGSGIANIDMTKYAKGVYFVKF